MDRTPVNPWSWSVKLGFDQAQHLEGHRAESSSAASRTQLTPTANQHAGDMAAQVGLALDNLEAVLAEAGMSLANVARLNIFSDRRRHLPGVVSNCGN
jgi:enamine deaminase RidA (YjgF/YER057c/UK114 family)